MQISNNTAMAYAQQGIQNGFNQLNQNSQVLADPNQTDKTEALIDTKLTETDISANIKAAKAADDRIGTLLDIMA